MNDKEIQRSGFSLKSLDFFSNPMEIWYNGNSRVQTTMGLLFTLGMAGLLVAVIYSSGSVLVHREKPTVVQNYILNDASTQAEVIMGTDIGFPVFKINNLFAGYPDTLTIQVTDSNLNNYSYSYCSLSISNLDPLFSKIEDITSYYCLNGETIPLLNDDNVFNVLKFQIALASCNDENLDNNCIPQEDLSHYIRNSTFEILFPDKLISTKDFTVPYNEYINDNLVSLDPIINKNVIYSYNKVQVQSDVGFIMQYFNYINFFILEEEEVLLSVDPSTNVIMNLSIILSNETVYISRYYMKAQELAAVVGGILNVYALIAAAICGFFSSNFQKLSMINNLFKPTDQDLFKNQKVNEQITENHRRKSTFMNPKLMKQKVDESDINIIIKDQIKFQGLNVSSQDSRIIKEIKQTPNQIFSNVNSIKVKEINNNYINNDDMNIHNRQVNLDGSNQQNELFKEEERIRRENDANIRQKIESLSAIKIMRTHLLKVDYQYSSFKFLLMNYLPFCKSVIEEKKKYNKLVQILKDRLDFTEVFKQMINFKRFKYYFLTSEQQLLLSFDNKLNMDSDAFENKKTNEENAKAIVESLKVCILQGGKLNDMLSNYYIKSSK